MIVNADALQVYSGWRVLTARPDKDEEARAKHYLYGHTGMDAPYSVGAWLRELEVILKNGERPIIVGGTGLYFRALTEGLSDIPPIAAPIRDQVLEDLNTDGLAALVSALHPDDQARVDVQNPARVTRALEVYRATSQSLAAWHDATPPPTVPIDGAIAIHMNADVDWLNARIAKRFDLMIAQGALDEVRANLDGWDDTAPSFQAIGAPELRRYLDGEISLETACELGVISTRQYAKRQRTWFRNRMKQWYNLNLGPE